MKKLFLMMAALLAGVSMSAQMKGDITLSGSLMFNSNNKIKNSLKWDNPSKDEFRENSTETTPADTDFEFSLGVGYFILPSLEVGVDLAYDRTKSPQGEVGDDKYAYRREGTFSIAPKVRYYVPIIEEQFYFTPGAYIGLGFGSGNEEYKDGDKIAKTKLDPTTVFQFGVDIISFEWKPSFNIGFQFSLGGLYYDMTTRKSTYEGSEFMDYKDASVTRTTTSNFSFGLDTIFQPKITAKWYFL